MGDTRPGPGRLSEKAERHLRRGRRVFKISFVLSWVVIVWLAIQQGVFHLLQPEPQVAPWRAVTGIVLSVPLAWLTVQLAMIRFGRVFSNVGLRIWLSFLLALAVLAALDVYVLTMFVVGAWWATVALIIPRRQQVAFAVVMLGLPAVRIVLLPDPNFLLLAALLAGTALWAGFVLLTNSACVWLWEVVNEAVQGAAAQARLAVTEERLRFARDMHDLLGHSLSSIAVKSELASRLATREPERAAAEMTSVQGVAREALREVRAAVSGYRDVDLADELASVRAVLTAAGVRCDLRGADLDLPLEQRTLAAWIVREGATNVLRHSTATRCGITLRGEEHAVIVEVHNDGTRSGTGDAVTFGNGLTGLRERVSAAGGTLSAGVTSNGGFLLRAVLPVPRAGGTAEAPPRLAERERGVPA